MPGIARILRALACTALIALTALALHAFAQREFTQHLRDQAAHALALAATGDTPYRWRFHDSEDIVAGRVFGAAAFSFEDDALVARSSGEAVEIGVPLPRPVD